MTRHIRKENLWFLSSFSRELHTGLKTPSSWIFVLDVRSCEEISGFFLQLKNMMRSREYRKRRSNHTLFVFILGVFNLITSVSSSDGIAFDLDAGVVESGTVTGAIAG